LSGGGFRPGRLALSVYVPSLHVPSLLHAAGYGMLAPAVPLYANALDVPVGWIGLLVSLQGLGAMASDVPSGLLAARFGGRAAMSGGLALSGIGALGLALASDPAGLFLAVPLVGIGLAAWATTRLTYVTDIVPLEQRGRALALVGGSSRIGMTVGPILGGLLGAHFGIEAAFYGHAALAALTLVIVATRPGRHTPPAPQEERAHRRLLRTVAQNRRAFVTSGGVAVALAMVRTARRVLIPLWGVWLGLDLAEIGLVIGFSAAVDMTLFYPVGVVMDRWGRKWTIVPCLVVLSASLAAVPFTPGFAALLAVGLVGGFGNGLGSGAIMTMGSDLAPRERSGEFLGVWRLISDSGGVFAPLLVGTLAQALTLGAAFFAASAVGLVGALLMALGVPEGLRRGRQNPRASSSLVGPPRGGDDGGSA